LTAGSITRAAELLSDMVMDGNQERQRRALPITQVSTTRSPSRTMPPR
jgi:hypothetical protein